MNRGLGSRLARSSVLAVLVCACVLAAGAVAQEPGLPFGTRLRFSFGNGDLQAHWLPRTRTFDVAFEHNRPIVTVDSRPRDGAVGMCILKIWAGKLPGLDEKAGPSPALPKQLEFTITRLNSFGSDVLTELASGREAATFYCELRGRPRTDLTILETHVGAFVSLRLPERAVERRSDARDLPRGSPGDFGGAR